MHVITNHFGATHQTHLCPNHLRQATPSKTIDLFASTEIIPQAGLPQKKPRHIDIDMNHKKFFIPLCAAVLLTACGGSDHNATPEPPPITPDPPPAPEPAPEPPPEPHRPLPTPVAQALTVMAGSADFADAHCKEGWKLPVLDQTMSWHTARFYALERIGDMNGSIYLLSDRGVEQCAEHYPDSTVHSMDGEGYLREFLPSRYPVTMAPTPGNRISGIFRQNDSTYALTLAVTNADRGYQLDDGYGMRFSFYRHHGPLLIHFPDGLAPYYVDYVSGLPVLPHDSDAARSAAYADPTPIPFAVIDGPPRQARFYAPHSLVSAGDGLHYFVDQGRVRTIDAQLYVRTLDLPSMTAGDVALDLDVDAKGQVHLVTESAPGVFAWHQLATGQRLDFSLPGYANPHISMAVRAGDAGAPTLMLGVRDDGVPEKWSRIYRVQAGQDQSQVQRFIGGDALPATAQDYLQNPTHFRLPNVRDVHFVDQTLWLSVGQALLAITVE